MSTKNGIEIPAALIDAINGLPDAAFLVMDDGVIVTANGAAEKMFGYSRSQLIGSQVDELMPTGARDYHHKVRTAAANDRRPRQFTSGRTFECERRGGELFQADIMLSPTEIDGVSMTWAIVQDLDRPSVADAGRQQALAALDAVGRLAATAFDLQSDFPVVADQLGEIIPHDRLAVMLLDPDDPGTVEVTFLAADEPADYQETTRMAVASSMMGWIVESKKRVSFDRNQNKFAPPAVQRRFKEGFVEICGAPLTDHGVVIGMLVAGTRHETGFTEFHRKLIDRLAEHLSVGVVNQRMRGLLQAQAQQSDAISEIGKMISSSPDLDAALSAASGAIRQLVPYDRLSILSIDLDAGVVAGMFLDGEHLPEFDNKIHVLPDEATDSIRKMFAEGGPLLFDRKMIEDISDSQATFMPYRTAGYQWALVVPLQVTLTPVGLMIFGRKDGKAYSEDQISIASRIGEQLSGPVANAFQLSKTEDEIRIESTLSSIGTVVDTTVDLQSGEHELGPLIRELVDNNSITISSVTADGLQLRLVYKDFFGIDRQDGWGVGTVHPWKGTTAEEIFRTRKPVLVNAKNWIDFTKSYPGAAPVYSGHMPTSVINVPLITNDQIFGFLTMRSVNSDAYSDADVAMSMRIGDRLAGSVALSELRRREADLADERTVLASIGGLLGAAIDLSEVWGEFAETLSGLLKFDHISLTGIDRDAGMAQVLQDSWDGDGLSDVRLQREPFPLGGTIAKDLASADQGIIFAIGDLEQWAKKYPGTYPDAQSSPLRSLIGAPLIWGGKVVAALFIHGVESTPYTSRDLRLAERVAAQIAGPVAGSLLRERDAALAAERETLARIGSVMGAALELGASWAEFTRLSAQIIEFDRVVLVSVDDDTRTATVLQDSMAGATDLNLFSTGKVYELDGTVTGDIAETASSLITNRGNPDQLDARYPGIARQGFDLPFSTNLGVPLIWGGKVVACLFFSTDKFSAYKAAELEVAEHIAAEIAGAVAGSLLRERDEALLRERALLIDIGELSGGASDISSVFNEFTDKVLQLVAFEWISIHEIDHQKGRVQRVRSLRDTTADADPVEFPLTGTMAERVATTHRSLLTNFKNFAELKNEFPGSPGDAKFLRPRSTIMVPLVWQGEVTMTLSVGSGDERLFGEDDLGLLERVAVQIAGPLAGALAQQREAELASERQRRETAELRAAALSELSETKNNFISAMSHELRTPLTSIVAFSDILSRQGEKLLEERQLQQVKIIQRNARRLEGMIEELLDASRMESGRFEIVRATFDFAAMIAESLESSELQFEAMSQTVKFEIVSEVMPINGDRGRLLQVVNNLLGNASKYSPMNTEIEILVTENDGMVNVEVRDRGPGISGEIPDELFEMFYRADDELTRSVPGTGIGLHVAKRIVEEHGGEITISSREGGGATARFWIPTGVNVLQ